MMFFYVVFNKVLFIVFIDCVRDWLGMFCFLYLDFFEIWKNGGLNLECFEDSRDFFLVG